MASSSLPTPPGLNAALARATTGHTQPNRIVLAALTAGLTRGYPIPLIQAWLTAHHPTVTHLVSGPAWHRLVSSAKQKVLVVSSSGRAAEEARRELLTQLTRRLFTHLLSPQPDGDLTPRSVNSARHALAVVGVDLLRNVSSPAGTVMDTALVHQTTVATRMGVSRLTAAAALRTAENLGWLSLVKRMPAGGTRYRLGRVRSREDQALMYRLGDTTDAVVEHLLGEEGPTGVDVRTLLVGDHPTLGYPRPREGRVVTEVDRTTWLIALVDAVHEETGVLIDPVNAFGLSQRLVQTHRRLWADAGLADCMDLAARLTEIGDATGATARATEAEVARREAAAARRSEVISTRNAAARAKRTVAAVIADRPDGLPEVVGPDHGADLAGAWAVHVQGGLADLDRDDVAPVRAVLIRRLTGAGWTVEQARARADRLVPTVTIVAAA